MTNSGTLPGRLPGQFHRDPMRAATPMIALFFALFVFGVLTFYATLNPSVSNPVFSDKRIAATLIGAGVYWLTIRTIAYRFGRSSREILLATLGIGIPGALLILAVRTLFDLATLDDLSGSFEFNVRWVVLWLGYFGAWVAGFFALICYRGLRVAQAEAKCAAAASAKTALPVTADHDAIAFVLAAVVDEMAQQPRANRAALAAALIDRAGYQRADGLGDPATANARVLLTQRLAARLAA